MRVGMGVGPFYVSGRVGGRRRHVRKGDGKYALAAWGILVAIGACVAYPLVALPVLGGLVAMVVIVPRYVKRKQALQAAQRQPQRPPLYRASLGYPATPPRPPQAPQRPEWMGRTDPAYAPQPTFTPRHPQR